MYFERITSIGVTSVIHEQAPTSAPFRYIDLG